MQSFYSKREKDPKNSIKLRCENGLFQSSSNKTFSLLNILVKLLKIYW